MVIAELEQIKVIFDTLLSNVDTETSERVNNIIKVPGNNTDKILILRETGETEDYSKIKTYRLILRSDSDANLDTLMNNISKLNTLGINSNKYKHGSTMKHRFRLENYLQSADVFALSVGDVNINTLSDLVTDDEKIIVYDDGDERTEPTNSRAFILRFNLTELVGAVTITDGDLYTTPLNSQAGGGNRSTDIFAEDVDDAPAISARTYTHTTAKTTSTAATTIDVEESWDVQAHLLEIQARGGWGGHIIFDGFDSGTAYFGFYGKDNIKTNPFNKEPWLEVQYVTPTSFPVSIKISNIIPLFSEKSNYQTELKLTARWVL